MTKGFAWMAPLIASATMITAAHAQIAVGFFNRGVNASRAGRYEEAITHYTKCIEADSAFVIAYFNRGNVYTKVGKYDEAIADYTTTVKLNPRYVDAYNNRGIVYAGIGDPGRAIADYTKAIQLKPDDSDAYLNRAISYRKIGKTALADADKKMNAKLTGQLSVTVSTSPAPPPSNSAQSIGGYRPDWIGQKMVVSGIVSRFVQRNVKGEPYVYIYFKERPDSTVVACTRDAPWLLNVLGIENFQSIVGKTLEFNGEVVNGTCTSQGAGLWIWNRSNARIVSGATH